MTSTIVCPLCKADIPVPVRETPQITPEGLTVVLDDTYVQEHIHMHMSCMCDWSPAQDGTQIVLTPDILCPVHGVERVT